MIHNFKRSGRKLHDVWALILFIIYVLGGITILTIYSDVTDYLLIAKNFDLGILIYCTGFIFFQFFSLMIAFLFFPGAIMHFGCLFLPIASIIASFFSGSVITICLTFLFSLISFALYFFYLKKQIKFAAVICQKSTEIISKNILLIVSYLTMCCSFFSILFYFIFISLINMKNQVFERHIASFCIFLLIFWIFFNTLYSCRVLISSTIFLKFLSDTNSAVEAFGNLLYSLGSICFGGLLIAIITSLRVLVDRDRADREQSGSSTIFHAILICIFAMLEDLINYSNQWAFTYIALEGKSYIRSTKEAWQTLFEGRSYAFINNYLAETILGVFSLFYMLFFFVGLFFLKESLFSNLKSIEKVISLLYVLTVYSFACTLIYSLFEAGVKALSFTFALFPDQVKSKDQELADAFERRKVEYTARA
ncbi:Choline Transporter-like (CTL) Family [Pseudoloma neurophilia]|uniref:Protein PNS1 n=1 Tax=Pseudoloma neurophilia TaxID=146866 RepID=A0A0R0LZM4_9MICR|nr:Choline Transporter-like (CTL) Family [Pseudoloma neurophilia]